MKKTMAWIMAAAMCLTATACGSTVSSTVSTAGSTAAGTVESSSVEGAFNLGLICPLSGSSAVSGQIMQNATKMAVDEINAAIGAQASSCTLANMEITKAAKIPQITPASSNVAVTQSGNDYIYQLTATDELHMRNVMGYMVDENNAKTFAILYESSDFGTGGFKIASTVCDDFGLEMVDSEVYNSGDTDFSVPLGKIKQANPDFVIFWGYHTEVAMICRQMQQYGIDLPCIGQGYNSPELTNLGGDAVNGVMISTAFDAANPDEKVQEFDKKYNELYGGGYDQNAPQSYDAVYIIKDAVERCIADGKDYTDGETLNSYIASTQWQGATGLTTFDENGRMDKDLLVIAIENGEHVIVKNYN